MTGYMAGLGPCFCCHRLFTFNVERVPSYQSGPFGPKEPICRSCIDEVNARRRAAGKPEWPVFPDAYEPQEVA